MTENHFLSMKEFHEYVSNRVILTACLAFFVVGLLLYRKAGRRQYKLPPGPTGVPILGYIPYLGKEPFKELDRLKKIYGNIFSLYLGQTYVVVLGDYEAVKETFSKTETLARPEGLFDSLPDRAGFTSVNGEEWMEQRKFCVKSMREHGVGRDRWESIIQTEVEDFIKIVSSFKSEPFDISKILASSISNNISTFILGKRLPFNHPDRMFLDDVLNEIMDFFALTSINSYFPIISDISVLLGVGSTARLYKRMKKMNNFFRKEVEKIKKTYKYEENDNFIADYLTEMDNSRKKIKHYFNETNLYGNIQTIFIGGSDTAKNSIHWLVLIMANFPHIQDKVHQEVDNVLGKDGKIQWSEKKKLPYTFATIMEGQRWRTIAPLNPTRITMQDIRIQNYDIPKGTNIIANNWGIHNDPKYWNEPDKFDPERFLAEDGKELKTKLESYNPFSYGRRNCPGDKIAMMEILLYFTALMQKFKIEIPKGKKVNLEGEFGLTYRAYEQEFHFVPR